ncbi:MAG: hypothetical protein GEU78_07025 [Actinobacteria bacterium]|nr:hypothetical protein [Actinomycetota bacterium]
MVIPARPRARPNLRALTIVVVLAILALLFGSARFYTDVLWFNEVGFSSVLWTSIRVQFLVGFVAFLVTALFVIANLMIARRFAPPYLPGLQRDPLEQVRAVIGNRLRLAHMAIGAFFGVLVAGTAAGAWQSVLLYGNRVDFGEVDPQFSRDIGFYVFELPLYDTVLGIAWFVVMATLFASAAAHFFHGTVRPEARFSGVHPVALAHLSVLLGLLALIKAAQYRVGIYQLNFSDRGVVTGASYTDVNAQLNALQLLTIISIISALLFIANIWFRRLSLPLAAVAIWILTAVLAGGVWPWATQRFSVDPQEPQREAPYIARNIEATRDAFGLTDVESRSFAADPDLTGDQVESNRALIRNVRLWDPPVLQRAYQQLQALRTYYQFPDVDVDRYEVDGEMRQVLLSARELHLDDLPDRSKTWANLHLQYTHGFGLVASLANASTSQGQPQFLIKDVPGSAVAGAEAFDVGQPRLYYGEGFNSREFSVVDTGQSELDYSVEEGTERTRYDGAGGIPVGGLFKRLAFAVRETDPNLVLSGLIERKSRILLYRNVRDRVHRVAPFLGFDSDPYVAAVDDRLVWVLDAFTFTRHYPYSQQFDVGEIITRDREAPPGSFEGELSGNQNYIRNSVKVAVDAYDGSMIFYIVDDEDPLVRAWAKAFPALFTNEEPPEELVAHFRYPEDLFKVQSEAYLTYHMTEAEQFYAREDEWNIAQQSSVDSASGVDVSASVQPTYLLVTLPGEDEQEFLLTRPFTPHNRPNMIALMAARADPGVYGELITIRFPRERIVVGPSQVSNLIEQDPVISSQLSLLRNSGSDTIEGALVILPIEDSLLYIQPLFLVAENQGIPELKKVIMLRGEQAVMGDSFEHALGLLFGLEGPAEPEPGEPAEPGEPGEPSSDLAALIAEAGELYEQAQQALQAGDFEEYGRLIEELGQLLAEAEDLSGATPAPSPSPTS